MRARKKPSPVSVGAIHESPAAPAFPNRSRGAGVAIRSFLRRLLTAWRVLTGGIDPNALEIAKMAASAPVPVIRTAMNPVHLRAKWWAHGPDLNFARGMVKRELMERAGEMIEYAEEESPDGGYYVSGDLYLYARS